MGKTNQHVVPRQDRWAVQGAGNSRAARLVDTQHEAIQLAREIARNQQSELIVHDQAGRINWRDSYGDDAFPPKG